jgi:Low molecular weight phosphotyrosine protein phosphatase
MTMMKSFAFLAVSAALQLVVPARASETTAPDNKTIVFVCLHGSVKSQMAAAHFNRIAKERGLPYTAISRGIEVDSSIPPRIREELNQEGLAPLDDVPASLTAAEATGAVKVVAFDMVPEKNRGTAEVSYWSDVPPTSKNYPALRKDRAADGHAGGAVLRVRCPW